MESAAQHVLSAYSFIKDHSLHDLLEAGYQTIEGNPIPSFDENVLIELCSEARFVFEKEENIIDLNGDFIIVGDIHGSFHDLLRILNYHYKCNLKVLFLGDYVDRGEFSLECITLLFALKVNFPETFYLIRGNHEFDSVCSQYGFKNEIIDYHNPKKVKMTQNQLEDLRLKTDILKFQFEEDNKPNQSIRSEFNAKCDEYYANHNDMNCYKYTEKLYEAFIQAFSYLPICAIINNTTFCIHGGLSPELEIIDHISQGVQRPINNFEDNKLLCDVVWSDPSNGFNGLYNDNPRGRGYLFNSDAVANFLSANSLTRIVRAHQCVKHGSFSQFSDKCITVFSASSYSPEMENKSGILKLFCEEDKIRFVTFSPLPRLKKSDAGYYKVQSFSKENKIQTCFSIRHPKLTTNVRRTPYSIKRSNVIQSQPSKRYLAPQCFSKPSFVTNSRKTSPYIRKPLIHSVSVDEFIDDDKSISVARSLQSINTISDNDNNETYKSILEAQSFLGFD